MTFVILDADFLSSFLKIQKLNLIKEFFGVDELIVTTAVFREISMTKLINNLIEIRGIKVEEIKEEYWDIELIDKREFSELGEGEKESILWCKKHPDSIFLINDKKARTIARRNSIKVLNIPAFLIACKNTGFLDKKEISDIINDLKCLWRAYYGKVTKILIFHTIFKSVDYRSNAILMFILKIKSVN